MYTFQHVIEMFLGNDKSRKYYDTSASETNLIVEKRKKKHSPPPIKTLTLWKTTKSNEGHKSQQNDCLINVAMAVTSSFPEKLTINLNLGENSQELRT
ncbi:Hypothetical predicted protein [Octopus vulgaris]|uniref:Uncharacterized protein n=1 Tax=Octopus vulgaris TaxID=6645 RepID=A0AA36BGU1_OCTVU|nr:Hypothetical predicted protein [Octopus vulgaris]